MAVSYNKPTPGTAEDTWGTLLNNNFEAIENAINGAIEITPDMAKDYWKIDGFAVTATAAELNELANVTATTTELNYCSGVTSAIQTQIDGKADLASPALTGTPTAPTPDAGDDSTQIATTAFVQSEAVSATDTHAALRSSSTVFGHAKIYVSSGNLYIETT